MLPENTINNTAFPALLAHPESDERLENLDVVYDASSGVLVVNWEGEFSSEEIRFGYGIMMSKVKAHKPRKLLLDYRKRVSLRRRDQRWVFRKVFPKMLHIVNDSVFVALVLPVVLYDGLVADMTGDELMHKDNFFIIHHSLYREEAFRWLEGMHKTSAN